MNRSSGDTLGERVGVGSAATSENPVDNQDTYSSRWE